MGKKARKTITTFGKDAESSTTFFTWAREKFEEKFVDNIPNDSIKDLPKNYMWVIGSFSYIFSALIFFYFIATGYRIQRTQEFVSLSKSDGECSDVALTVEGSFLATDSGIWEGFESFNYHKATYFIHLSQYKETDATFWQQMNEIVLPQLHYMAANASDRNTVDNLMLWMTWTASLRPHIEGDLNFFSMTGDIGTVMNRGYFFGITSGPNAVCSIDLESGFNVKNGLATVQYSAEEFFNESSCYKDVNAEYVGYNDQYDFDVFELQFDVVSAIVCMAVNAGVMEFGALTRVEEEAFYVELSDRVYLSTSRVNYHYGGMTPLRCYESVDSTTKQPTGYNFCLLNLGFSALLPFFRHWEECTCTEDDASPTSYCQYFDFLIGGVFFPIEPWQPPSADDDDDFYADDFYADDDTPGYMDDYDDDGDDGPTVVAAGFEGNVDSDYFRKLLRSGEKPDEVSESTSKSLLSQSQRKPRRKAWRESEAERKHRRELFKDKFSDSADKPDSLRFQGRQRQTRPGAYGHFEADIEAEADDALPTFSLTGSRNNLAAMLDLLANHTPSDVNHLVYDAAFDASLAGLSDDPSYRSRLFSFCSSTTYGNCSILTFNAYDFEKEVSEYYHSVLNPACRDTFTPTPEAWRALSSTPPTEFTQEYYACKATHLDALFNSMGIAAGNTSTLLPLAFLFLMPLVYLYLTSSGNMPPPKEFADDEVSEALQTLGLMLLRINAGKTSQVKSNSALMKLTKELAEASRAIHELPDSDDDDDDEEVDADSDDDKDENNRQPSTPPPRRRRSVFDSSSKPRAGTTTTEKGAVNPMQSSEKREGKREGTTDVEMGVELKRVAPKDTGT